MSVDKIKDTLNSEGLKEKVINDPEEKFSYLMPAFETFYTSLNPTQVTLKNHIIYLNSDEGINDNAYLAQLVDLYKEGSSTHSACIDLRNDMSIGSGLIPVNPSPETEAFLNTRNSVGDTLQDIWEKITFDYNTTGMYAVQVIYNKMGKVAEVFHTDITTVRAVSPDSQDPFVNNINTWALSTKWAKITNQHRYTTNNSAVYIKTFNPKTWAEDGGRQLLVCRKYIPGSFAYGLPHYQSVINYIELDNQLSKFHLNKVSQGFFPNVIISLTGNPSKEEKERFKNKFNRKYVGADKSKILFIWSEVGEENQPKIIPFSTNDDAQIFKDLNDILTQKILTAHRIQPELASIPTANASLGGDANKINVSYSFTIESVIKPLQKTMLKSFNRILITNGLTPVTVKNDGLKLNQQEVNNAGGNTAPTQ